MKKFLITRYVLTAILIAFTAYFACKFGEKMIYISALAFAIGIVVGFLIVLEEFEKRK